MENKEIRVVPNEDSEVRVVKDSRTIEGYGIVFNKESRDLGGFREIIIPEAIDGVIERSDILALLNHDVNKGVLARSTNGKGTMKLSVDSRGVKYSFEAPSFDLGTELVEGIRRGDIKGSSFAFTLAPDGWTFDKKTAIRTITKFDKLYDMSPCYHEAYEDTTVALRNIQESDSIIEPEVIPEPIIEETIVEPTVKAERVQNALELELRFRHNIHKLNLLKK